MLNLETFLTRISTRAKIFIVSLCRNKMKQNQQFQNKFHTITALKNILKVIYLRFRQIRRKSMISSQTKALNTCFINLTTGQNLWKKINFLYVTQQKQKIDFSLKTIESRDRQFLIEKLIHNIAFKGNYQSSTEKNPKIIETIEKNYKVNRRMYQSLFSDITESFFEYIHSLDPDEIQELDSDLKANGWGVQSLTEIQDAHHLLTIFQVFYYLHRRLPFTNVD